MLGNFTEPDNRFDHVHVDIIKLPLAGKFQYCLTIIDRFSRWPAAVPLADIRADTVANAFMENWVSQLGTPLRITSDQGKQFESALFTSMARLLGTKHLHTSPYHPQANGLVERFHRTLKAALTCGAPTPWPELLSTVLLGLRTAYKNDLQASSAEMLFGTALRVPGEFFVSDSISADASSFTGKLRLLFQTLKPVPTSRHMQHRPFVHKDLATCTHVFRRVDSIRKPLDPPYTGPHEVVKRINEKNYVISIEGTEKVISTDALKPAYQEVSDNVQPSPPSTAPSPPTAPPPPTKRVSFSLPNGKDTGGRVVMATPVMPSSQQFSPTAPRVDRRKQILVPRTNSLVISSALPTPLVARA